MRDVGQRKEGKRKKEKEKKEKEKKEKEEEKKKNKAGYTATSCGRVGRSGNARFHTFRLVLTNGPTDRRTDKASYRVACPQLKTKEIERI